MSARIYPPTTLGLLLGCVALTATGCKPDANRAGSAAGKPNVLLIVVDTLRADKLGCYGNPLGLTPKIDRLAEQAARFEHAYSHAPWTLPSMASLLTSTYPFAHGAGGMRGAFKKLDDPARTLGECFHDAGYATGAIVNVLFLGPQFGMNQGFAAEDYDFVQPENNQKERRASDTTDAAIRWLQEEKDRPFFLMVHYFDPHLTYDPPSEFRAKLALEQDQSAGQKLFGTARDVFDLRMKGTVLDPTLMTRLERLHNGEIAYADEEVGRLLEHLDQLKLTDDTIVVFTSDHGEEFLDHGGFEHGHTLYDELLHVPLIIRFGGAIAPNRITSTVRHVDVAPTLCELARITPELTFIGASLLPLITSPRSEQDRDVYSEGNFWGPSWTSWRHDGAKLVQRPDRTELYRVRSDPHEQEDVSAKAPELRESLLKEMNVVRAGSSPARGATPSLSPEEQAHLESIGYVGGSEPAPPSSQPDGS